MVSIKCADLLPTGYSKPYGIPFLRKHIYTMNEQSLGKDAASIDIISYLYLLLILLIDNSIARILHLKLYFITIEASKVVSVSTSIALYFRLTS